MGLTRRDFLGGTLGAGAAWLAGCDREVREAESPPWAEGERLGVLDWPDADPPLFDASTSRGWDGRRYYDLARVGPGETLTPRERFFLRTFRPESLAAPGAASRASWTIRLSGGRGAEERVALADLPAGDRGAVLIECAGNSPSARFGLMGCARWEGIALGEILARHPAPNADALLRISGVDDHATPSRDGHSTPGAAWIFDRAQLEASGAFLATGINGAPLAADGGAPVRLVVPGWYGCTAIKWVDAIEWVAADAEATSQMREFARRTHQRGVPERARDYRPAEIDPAALPVRVERWRVRGETLHRVFGVAWGVGHQGRALHVRIGSDAAWTRVTPKPVLEGAERAWSLWDLPWRPPSGGPHTIRARYPAGVRQRRQNAGYHDRTLRT